MGKHEHINKATEQQVEKPDPLRTHFEKFRKNTVGVDHEFQTPFGKKKLHYFDWTASGRLYAPIEDAVKDTFGPFVGNTHSESSETGMIMTASYHRAREIIKEHTHADGNDALIVTDSGATGAINKLQRILGLKSSDQTNRYESLLGISRAVQPEDEASRPVIFISHMEHHSNQTSWEETNADVVVVPENEKGLVEPDNLRELLKEYKERKIKIGSFTAGSNVTGIKTPYHTLAKIMHENAGLCFVDFAATAPYITIDMHPEDPNEKLDAIFFSPHKFLGGPGTPGILLFDKKLYPKELPPDHPGGGTVLWTNPWGGKKYHEDIETREDGGTPPFLQTIRAALAIKLKEEMGVENILAREKTLSDKLITGLKEIPAVTILADNEQDRLGIVSFYIKDVHHNLAVKLLNDRDGIQVRGGCSCAGTYGHCLLHIDRERSKAITDTIDHGDQSAKPGWVRASLHPTLHEEEVDLLVTAVKNISENHEELRKDYIYDPHTNEFRHKNTPANDGEKKVTELFNKAFRGE